MIVCDVYNVYCVIGPRMHRLVHGAAGTYLTKLDRGNTNFALRLFEFQKTMKWGHEYDFLKYYQNVVRIFMEEIDIDARGLLIYHTMGLGKSILAIAVAMDAIKSGRQPIILLTKSLQENMRGAIKKYIKLRFECEPDYFLGRLPESDVDAWIKRNILFVSLNASNMLKQMGKAAEGTTMEEFDAALEKKFGEVLKMASLDGKLLIVDEAHNLFRAITNGSKNAMGLYDMVMKARNLKVMFLTGTPIANDPFELVPCFNMIGSTGQRATLPENYKDFYALFADPKTGMVINKEKLQNRIMGLVSHLTHHSTPGAAIGLSETTSKVEFPRELDTIIERVPMDLEQYVIYQLARDKEKDEGSGRGFGSRQVQDMPSMLKPKSGASSSYRVHSRQLSNYCPPDGFRNEKDPAKIPEAAVTSAKFRKIYENLGKHKGTIGVVYSQFVGIGGLGIFQRFLQINGYEEVVLAQVLAQVPARRQLNDAVVEDKLNTDISDDILPEYTGDAQDAPVVKFSNSDDSSDVASSGTGPREYPYLQHIDEQLRTGSSRWWSGDGVAMKVGPRYAKGHEIRLAREFDGTLPEVIEPGCLIIDSDDSMITGYALVRRTNEGLETVQDKFLSHESAQRVNEKIIVDSRDRIGASAISAVDSTNVGGHYAVISGEIDVELRAQIQERLNSPDNKHGEQIDLLLISSTGAEGLDLKNVRHIHIMEPYWNWGRIAQIKARGIRNDSHIELPEAEKDVRTYVYIAVPPFTEKKANEPTTDEDLWAESVAVQASNESFLQVLKEVCIECMLNGERYCRVCSPTDAPLYTGDIMRDIKAIDPCTQVKEENILAQDVELDGVKYYYVDDAKSIYDYKIFVFDKELNGYRPMSESDPLFAKLIELIGERMARPVPVQVP